MREVPISTFTLKPHLNAHLFYYSVFIKRFSPNIAKHLYLCCLAGAPAQDGDEELGDLYDELVVGVEPGQREVQQLQPQRHVVPVIVISV